MDKSYLRTDFQKWMSQQKKSNGSLYKNGTVNAYSSALRNSTAKLNIKDINETDLFYITSSDKFEEADRLIRSAPNFNEVDLAAGNKAYSSGLVLYGRFLQEREQPAVWIFQGNPKYYDVISAVDECDTITWAVNQYKNHIKEGDKAYIWVSGQGGGIVAEGTVLCDPKEVAPDLNDPYRQSDELNQKPYKAVDIEIHRRFTESIIERAVLLADKRTERMEILTYPGATNFRVTKEQDAVIESIIDGSYEPAPAATNTNEEIKENEANYSNNRKRSNEDYSEEDFLAEVYMDQEKYQTLKNLLIKKKNLILSGAPGVGKTFAAERLAYSMMGEKDKNRVAFVQFHQSYSYEDFIMGYRPTETGFSLAEGPFYQFCKKAANDSGQDYFFIIDEINRGNLSKVFGELLMLIENDKRGKEIRLLYADEEYSVPENVYIIGMMNTADRSLALIDYALRRRFAFFEFEPAFASEGFKQYQNNIGNTKFDRLINTVVAMNETIAADDSLGSGFRIGHSYFSAWPATDDNQLSEVVEYELVPLISEYWFDELAKAEHWTARLRGAVRD